MKAKGSSNGFGKMNILAHICFNYEKNAYPRPLAVVSLFEQRPTPAFELC
jgi:hypothetical protein